MRGRLLLSAAAVALAVFACVWLARTERAPPLPAMAFPAPSRQAHARIEQLLAEDPAFRNDVVFLLVATLRDRCRPAEAGQLARMANRAALPVLAAVSAVTRREPALDRPIYRYVQHRADATGCDVALQVPAGAGVLTVPTEHYAETFPDSYFDPQRRSVPRDFGGRALRERAADACNSVAYSLLPLGGTDWRCSTLQANARARVRGLCEAELRRQHGTATGELDMAVGRGMQDAVVQAVAVLPQECR